MRHHPGTIRAFWSTLAAGAFLALTLTSCAVTVAMPGSPAGTPTLPAARPSTPAPTQPAAPDKTPDESSKDETNGTEKSDDTKKEPETPAEEPKGPETPDVPEPEPQEPEKPEPATPEPGAGMQFSENYKATWHEDDNGLLLEKYVLPQGASINLELPTGRNYAIGEYAIIGSDRVYSVKIPNCVTKIGKGAFQSAYMSEIEIPKSVTIMDDSAFEGCSQLQTVTLKGNYPQNQLGSRIFANCSSLTTVNFEGTIDKIPEGMFSCTGLTTITIPNGVKTIGASAFADSSLESIYIPATVTNIAANAFDNCWGLTISFGGTKERWEDCAKGLVLDESITVQYNQSSDSDSTTTFSLFSDLLSLFL